jgi:hypothetical protein
MTPGCRSAVSSASWRLIAEIGWCSMCCSTSMRPGWQVADGDRQPGLVGECGQLGLPRANREPLDPTESAVINPPDCSGPSADTHSHCGPLTAHGRRAHARIAPEYEQCDQRDNSFDGPGYSGGGDSSAVWYVSDVPVDARCGTLS